MATPSPTRRLEVLRPFLERLATLGRQAPEPAAPSLIKIGSRSLQIEPWERNALLLTVGTVEGEAAEWEPLLAESVALRAKTLGALESLEACDGSVPEQAEAIYADLLGDAIIGFALLAELQRAVDHLVVEGEIELAKKLTKFRTKLSRSVADLEPVIGQAAMAEAEERAVDMLAAAPPATDVESANDARSEPNRPERKKRIELEKRRAREPEPSRHPSGPGQEALERQGGLGPGPDIGHIEDFEEERPLRSWALPLTWLLAVLVAAWLVLTVRPALNRTHYPSFATADFARHEAIQRVVSRAPSLFVTLDARVWNGLDEAGRRDLVRSIGETIGAAGYTGAHFTSESGRTLAQWMKSGGTQLVRTP